MEKSLLSLVAIVVVVIVFLIMRKRGGGNVAAALAGNFSQQFCTMTGLTANANDFSGSYRGYDFVVKSETGTDYAGAIQRQGWKMYPRLTVTLRAAGSSFPLTVLREEHNVLVDTNQKINDLISGGGVSLPAGIPALKGKLPRVNGVYSADQAFAAKIVSDPELSKLLANWFYPNITMNGDVVELKLDHEHAQNKFRERMASPGYWVEAMNICARIVDIAKA